MKMKNPCRLSRKNPLLSVAAAAGESDGLWGGKHFGNVPNGSAMVEQLQQQRTPGSWNFPPKIAVASHCQISRGLLH